MDNGQIERAEKLLAEAGFKLTVNGCGCCGSPSVRLSHNDTDIVFDSYEGKIFERDNTRFSMHDDDH